MTSGIQVASLFAQLDADTGSFNRKMKESEGKMNGFGKKASSIFGAGIKAAVGVGVVAIGTLGATIAKTTSMAADMEQAIANISAIMGLTAEETAKVDALITDLGLDPNLKVTAVEAASAIEMLGKNGVSLDNILGGVARSTVLLANSTGADFGMAADIATDAMAQFNLKAEDMNAVVNGITGVTKSSKFDINDYGLAIAQAGGVAGSVGVSFEDFNATIAAISPNFSGGSDAGTSLKVMLQRLVPQSNKAQDSMRALGLITTDYDAAASRLSQLLGLEVAPNVENVNTAAQEYVHQMGLAEPGTAKFSKEVNKLMNQFGRNAFFDAEGQMKDMNEIAGILAESFADLSEEQRIEQAATIFGTDAMRAAFGLIEAGTPGIVAMKKAIGNVDAEQAAATRMDTFRGALEIAQGVVETMGIQIGKEFLPLFRMMVERFTELADRHGPRVIEWFGKLASALDTGIRFIIEAVGSGTLLSNVFAKLPSPIQLLIRKSVQLFDAIVVISKPIIDAIKNYVSWQDVLIALAAVVASIAIPALASFVAAIAPVLAAGVALIAGVSALRRAWEMDFGGIQEKTRSALEYVQNRFAPLYQTIRDFGRDALGEIVAWAMGNETEFTATQKIWDVAKATFMVTMDDISDAIRDAWPGVRDTLTEWGAKAFDIFAKQFPGAAEILMNAWGEIKRNWSELVASVLGLLDAMGIKYGDEWEGMGQITERVGVLIQKVVEAFTIAITTGVNTIINAFTLVSQLLQGDWVGAWETTKELVSGIVSGLVQVVGTALDGILQLFGVNMEDITGKLNSFRERFIAAGENLIDGLRQGFVNKWTDFKNWTQGRWQNLVDGFTSFFGISSPSKLFAEYGGHLLTGLQKGIDNNATKVVSAITALGSQMSGAMRSVVQDVNGIWANGIKFEAPAGFALNAQGEFVPKMANAIIAPLPTSAPEVFTTPTTGGPTSFATQGNSFLGAQESAFNLSKTINKANASSALKGFGGYNILTQLNNIGQSSGKITGLIGRFASDVQQAFVNNNVQSTPRSSTHINRLTNTPVLQSSVTVDVLTALNGLISAIERNGLGNKFDLSLAPESSGDQRQDLINLVQYLQALYA